MVRYLTVLFLILLPGLVFPQDGDYFLSHFSPPDLSSDHQIFDLKQGDNGMFYMAHRSGILTFDGTDWQDIPAKTSVFALIFDPDGESLYAGGPTGFQRVRRDETYEWQYESLSEEGLVKDIIRMVQHDSTLYGMSPTNLYAYDIRTQETKAFSSSKSEEFANLFVFEDQLHVLDIHGNVFILSNGKLRPSASALANKKVAFVCRAPSEHAYLVGSVDNELYLFDGEYKPILKNVIDRRDREYLMESEITGGLWVSDSLAVISTLKGGIVFIRPLNSDGDQRNVQKIINYQNDLPDNEVFTMALDNSGAIWIGHEKGFTRVAPRFPFRRYDHFPGLEGKIQMAYRHDGVLYVGTTQGLFYLEETAVYENVKHQYKEWYSGGSVEKKGFFNKLFNKKKSEKRQQRTVTRTSREFHSIQYEYRRVASINAKVLHLAEARGKLVCAGLDGVFEVENKKARRLTSSPTQYFHYSESGEKIYATTHEGNIIEISELSGKPEVEEILEEITEPVTYIFENRRGELFLTGVHTVFIYSKGSLKEIPFENPFFEDTYGIINSDTAYLINRSGIYVIDNQKLETRLVKDISKPEQLVQGVNDQVWLLGEDGWNAPGSSIKTGSFKHLTVLNRIRFISESAINEGIWVIAESGMNETALYHLLPQETYEWYRPNDLFLHEIITEDGVLSPEGNILIDQERSHVSFVFRQPEYSGVMDTEYMYQLQGEEEEWSDWSSTNRIVKFNYLPAGEYTLRVRTRNALGQIDELDNILFEVQAPYWKRTWFYALEFAIIALMLLISIRMKAMGYKYRFVSRLLALLTLITIIELLQALGESKFETEASPVFGFIIQVIMAVMILPVEEILRKYIFREKNVKVFDIFSLRDKTAEAHIPDKPAADNNAGGL